MSKVITSPLQRWAGEVTIADPLTLAQAELIQDGFEKDEPIELTEAKKNYFDYVKDHTETDDEAVRLRLHLFEIAERHRPFHTVSDKRQLPAILGCVEKWDLKNFPENVTAENFPASPRGDSHKLIDWLFSEIRTVYFGEAEVPNA